MAAGDPDRFRRDLESEEALEAFHEDLKDAGYRGMGRFPAFILRGADRPAVALIGYRALEKAAENRDLIREGSSYRAPAPQVARIFTS